MPKAKTAFFCSECGQETSGWMGKCPGCGAWNTIVEEKQVLASTKNTSSTRGWISGVSEAEARAGTVVPLDQVTTDKEQRYTTGIHELDRVLGGGFVRGSLVLVGGDPGIGKSTLLMQVCGMGSFQGEVLYVSGEESLQQVRLRADRLAVVSGRIKLLAQTSFVIVAETIIKTRPRLVIIDSIQTMYSDDLAAAPGSVSQVREVTAGLLRIAKSTDTTIVLVGHVTKDGAIAGPRILEHMVDTVLYFEGERQNPYRIIRAVKNRFGATDELGIFEMTDHGLLEVANASAAMLEGRPVGVPGTVVTACMEGTRPILIEIQALINETNYAVPQRMTQGLDRNRVSMLLAVLEKKVSVGLGNMDAFINVIGGMKADEPALDLAILAAVLSCIKNRPIRQNVLIFGEVGLTGEIRPVASADRRVMEAKRMGFVSCILPGGSRKSIDKSKNADLPDLLYVDHIGEMMDILF
jgi:DNA repair protein RadA/Sms